MVGEDCRRVEAKAANNFRPFGGRCCREQRFDKEFGKHAPEN